MSGIHKRNKETFNSIFRKLCKTVSPVELTATSRNRRYYGDVTRNVELHRPLTIPAFKLLARETRKWYIKDRKGFGEWAMAWDTNAKRIEQERRRYGYPSKAEQEVINSWYKMERLLAEQWIKNVARFVSKDANNFVSAYEGDDKSLTEPSPEARVEAVLKGRRAKVTNKMCRGALWTPGTLVEVNRFFVQHQRSWGNASHQLVGWFYPITGRSTISYDALVNDYYGSGRLPPTVDIDTPEWAVKAKTATGLILSEEVISGEGQNQNGYFCWTRLIKVLVRNQVWVLALHPTLEAKGLGKWVTALNGAKSGNGLTCKSTTVIKSLDLMELILNEGREGHERLICKENTL